MSNIKNLGFKVIATAILGFSLIGCGGSSGDGGTTTAVTKTGTFVDSPVEGLKYETATLSGYTSNKGEFQYKDGETVTFKIGNLELGSARGEELITPLTLTGENDLNNISSKATNIARILQSLDENSSNQGKIKLSSIDLESDADLNTILSKAQSITSKTYTLKDSITAKADMKEYVVAYNKYTILTSGSYRGTTPTYYLLTMPERGNVIITGGGSSVFIYDINLNPIRFMNHDEILEAGIYVLKVNYTNFSDGSGSYFTINSPVLD